MAVLPLLLVSYTVIISYSVFGESPILLRNESFSDESREVYVSMAYDLHMFIPNVISVHTNWEHLRLMYSTVPADARETIENGELHKVSPIIDGWYGVQIKYHVPFYDIQPDHRSWHRLAISLLMCGEDACAKEKIKEMVLPFKVNPTFLHIIGEVERTRYRPGEVAKARFHVLNARTTGLTKEPFITPKLLLSPVNTSNFGAKELLPLTGMYNPTEYNFTCTSLVIRGEGMEYERRLDLPANRTIYVEFELWEGEQQGTWLMELECMQHRKVISFQVAEPISEPFHAYMIPTQGVSTDSANIDFRVCARHYDGSFVEATVSALICVCEGNQYLRFPLSQEDEDRLFENSRCFEEHGDARRCETVVKQLSEECVHFRVSTYPFRLNALDMQHANEHVLYCFRIYESITGVEISKCEHSQHLESRGAWLSTGDTIYYHPGLPFQVVTDYWHPGVIDLADQLVRLEVSQQIVGCQSITHTVDPSRFVGYFHQEDKNTNQSGRIVFTVPPIRSTGFMRMVAGVKEVNKTKRYHEHIGYLDSLLFSEKTLKPWPSISGTHFQVWLPEDGRVQGSCLSGSAEVKLISNVPLSGRVIWVETYTIGLHNISFIPALDNSDTDKCQSMDNEFGHYTCTSNGITCLSGWEGDDCMKPKCADHCSSVGGWCLEPGECVCRRGWVGSSCYTCLPCEPIMCASLNYLTCICEETQSNYTCQNLESVIVKPQTKPSVRTIYQRDVRINIDFKFGKGSKVLFYFYEQIRQGRQERVITEVFVDTTDCYPPAHKAKTSFDVFTKVVASGNVISMGFELPYSFKEDNETEVCHVRTTVPSYHTVQIPNQLEWDSYTDKLYSIWGSRWDVLHSPIDPLQVFQSAGLMIFKLGELAQLNMKGACPDMDTLVGAEIDEFKLYDGFLGVDPKAVDHDVAYFADNIYEPVWLFQPLDRIVQPDGALGVEITTNFSDEYTSLGVQVICTTQDSGVWIGQSPELSTTWIIRSVVVKPTVMIVGMSTHLNVSLTLSPNFNCGQVTVQSEISPQNMLPTTADSATFCICSSESKMWSFGVIPVETGYLNFSLVTTFIPYALLCNQTIEPLLSSSTVIERYITSEDHDLFASTSGFTSTVHFTNLICHPHDPYLTLSWNVLENYEFGTAQVVGKIHVYSMCTFDYFPGELEKTHRDTAWDTNKAEELISRIISATSYIFYLKTPKFLGDLPKFQHISPLENELAVLLNRLKYFTRKDGSISNFGENDRAGSVWLSAEALRATEMAGQTGYYESHVQLQLQGILSFIKRQIDSTTGCITELGTEIPFVLHGMARRLSTELLDQMLTSFVIVALHEQPHKFSSVIAPYADDIQTITDRFRQCISWGKTAYAAMGYEKLSNFHIALAAYATTMLNDQNSLKEAIIANMLLRNVTVWSKERKVSMFYLTDDTDFERENERKTLTTEATAYMYLTLARTGLFHQLLLPIVKYLVQNHVWEANAQSTHSSALVKQVLADYFSYRMPTIGFSTEALLCTTALYPVGHVHFEEVRGNEVYEAKYVSLPEQERSTLREIKQAINGLTSGQCALIDTSLNYRSEFKGLSSRANDIFTITVRHVALTEPTRPVVEICFQFIPQLTPERTGYLIMEVWPPAYTKIDKPSHADSWSNNQSEAILTRARSGEIDSKGNLVLTFDGITKTEVKTAINPTEIRRCAEVRFHTLYFADNPDPVVVRVYDFHLVYPVTRYTFILPALRMKWNLDERPYRPETHPAATTRPCPSCMNIEMMSDEFMMEMRRTVCRSRGDLLVFQTLQAPFQLGSSVVLHTTRMPNVMNRWSTNLTLPSEVCDCTIPPDTRYMMAFTNVPFDYSVLDNRFSFNVTASTKSIDLLMITDDKVSVRRMRNALSRPPTGPACAKLQMAVGLIYSNLLTKF